MKALLTRVKNEEGNVKRCSKCCRLLIQIAIEEIGDHRYQPIRPMDHTNMRSARYNSKPRFVDLRTCSGCLTATW
jgi:hypothetical protein